MRASLLAALAVGLSLVTVPSAIAGELIDGAAEGLRDDPVYVHPDAERMIGGGAEPRLEARIATGDAGAVYLAILPEAAAAEAGGNAGAIVEEIFEALGRNGTYAVVVGDSLRAGSTELASGAAGRLATASLEANGARGVESTLLDFVDRVAAERASGGTTVPSAGRGEGGSSGLWALLAVLALPAGFVLLRRRRARGEEAAPLDEVRQEAEADLVALAEDVQTLEAQVAAPGADPRAEQEYNAALEAYALARAALDRARTPKALGDVSAALEEGRYAMEAAKARLERREPPERRAPCFFDPRHGPSARDIDWAPPGGRARRVPVCAADAARVDDGIEPESRQVSSGGRRMPYWAAGPAYQPYTGGFFALALPALLIGSSLDWGTPGSDEGTSAGDFDAGGGDFGGGGFGDFGGGGDVGGGDFGGGGE